MITFLEILTSTKFNSVHKLATFQMSVGIKKKKGKKKDTVNYYLKFNKCCLLYIKAVK